MSESEKRVAYKGFEKDLKCRGFQFEVGKEYEHDGKVEVCSSGFHSCEYPLDVFSFYGPASSRFALVKASGEIQAHSDDSKIASAKLFISAELKIPDLVAAAVKWIFDRAISENSNHATGIRGAASSTGIRGAASSTGYQGAASSTGIRGAASSTGEYGAASSTGY
ncbi:MAG: DUF7666 domain-containing protein, partial [Acidobacteriaceae bacterium]